MVTVPYQGYEAKYLAALIGKSGAPDFFMGMTHHWCGQYDFCDQMPADLAKVWDENLPKYMVSVGQVEGRALRDPHRARELPADVHQRRPLQEGRPGPEQAAEDARRVAGRHEEADRARRQGRGDPGRVRAPPQGPSGRHHRQVPAVRPRLRRPDAVAGPREGDRLRQQPRDGGGAPVLPGPRPEAQGREPGLPDAGGRVRPEAGGHDLPRVVVLRLGEEERARRGLQGLRAAVREDLPRRRATCSRGRTSSTRTARTSRRRGSS